MNVIQGTCHCLISNQGLLGMSLIIMGLTTRDLQNQKEETKNYKFLEFGVDWAEIE